MWEHFDIQSKTIGILKIKFISKRLTIISVPIWTFFAMSIMSSASFAIHFAWFSHVSGKPDTAIYLSPTVSTCIWHRIQI